MKKKLYFSVLLAVLISVIVSGSVFAEQTPGEYLPTEFPAYENSLHGISGPEKFMIWDAPLFYSENYTKVIRWEVQVEGGELGTKSLSFYTNPFSLYWDRSFDYLNPDTGETERILAPIGRYRATISAFGGENQELQAQRDVEIVIPDPEKSWYEDNPDVYWPKTGADLRIWLGVGMGLLIVLLIVLIIVRRKRKNHTDN